MKTTPSSELAMFGIFIGLPMLTLSWIGLGSALFFSALIPVVTAALIINHFDEKRLGAKYPKRTAG